MGGGNKYSEAAGVCKRDEKIETTQRSSIIPEGHPLDVCLPPDGSVSGVGRIFSC